MFELPFDVRVSCTDGHAGTSVAVTFNVENNKVSHLVVEDANGVQRLVPLPTVSKTDHDHIWLDCTEDQLRQMPTFLTTEYVERAEQRSGDWADDEGEWEDGIDVSGFERAPQDSGMPLEVERVPEGEINFHRSMDIEATDGHVGSVDALVLEDPAGPVTHLALHKGHLWGKKQIRLPLTAVENIDSETVYLNVDKKAVEGFAISRE